MVLMVKLVIGFEMMCLRLKSVEKSVYCVVEKCFCVRWKSRMEKVLVLSFCVNDLKFIVG